ncbi:hypothetical protein N3K66_001442 [Trichothecium roseum]|uniref:Uncharacterized protein n=1 Tax=Trichothecium roseum TaxID=47278 RepID=A0ACC0VHI9_9HYPO|nr:hypothetical protein N3K66_001442 [Trichothecium roseum]
MSADTTPIAPARFAAALADLSVETLHLKVLEIRNSIAHLQYSNDQLRPFAEGSAVPLSSAPSEAAAITTATVQEPDQDCVDAIKENEGVIDRMAERIALIRIEVEGRGVSWAQFESMEETEAKRGEAGPEAAPTTTTNGVNGDGEAASSSPWTDGTFQTGTIRNGEVQLDAQPGQRQGGTLSDEELRRRIEERMRDLGSDGDTDDGMHL